MPGISIPHTLDDLPIWQILAPTEKWNAAQKENSGKDAGSSICGVTDVTGLRRKEDSGQEREGNRSEIIRVLSGELK